MKHLEERARQAEKIIAQPAEYKVCEGCGSIVKQSTVICPVCKSYRFDEREEAVVEQAKILGSREATTITDEDL
ncbi:MAG: hypothetical protein K1X66_07025 [Verrucomicrobiae bacterium]|nr:hypothetical protein [Verrucomicrobiae bacterium]